MGLKDKLFNSEKVQKALKEEWNIHSQMFRGIMEPAFIGDDGARIELVASLNLITRGQYPKAITRLGGMKRYCKTNEDKAALLFFMGLACERSGASGDAILFLSEASKYEPQFYLLYNMLAKLLVEKNEFAGAIENFSRAMECLADEDPDDVTPQVSRTDLAASIYGNIAACLLHMREYDEAEWSLRESEKYKDGQDGLLITWAMLYAATDRVKLARKKMAKLKERNPELEAQTSLMLEELIAGKNPRFSVQKDMVEKAGYDAFWSWFNKNADRLYETMGSDDPNPAINGIYGELEKVFPFMRDPVEFSAYPDEEGKFVIEFCDNYIVSLTAGLEKLIEKAPKELRGKWSFGIIN